MSGSIAATGYGSLDQIVANASATKQTIAQLTQETASGYLSTDYAGLGQGAAAVLNLGPQLAAVTQVQTNTQAAATIQTAAQAALGQIESIASSFATQALTMIGISGAGPTVSASAHSVLAQVANLLDTQVGGVYVFAGQDSAEPPVPDPNSVGSSAFAQAIQAAVAQLPANGQAATSAATLVIASPGGTSPFSATLDAAGVQSVVDLGGGQYVALAPLANANSNAVSTGAGTTSTGSYTRDILRGLVTLSALGSVSENDPGYVPMIQDTIASLNGAVGAINTDIGGLGTRQNQVTAAQTEAGETSTALKTQIGSLQDADLTQLAVQLSDAQTQLQASYQLISNLSTLSLAKFLPA